MITFLFQLTVTLFIGVLIFSVLLEIPIKILSSLIGAEIYGIRLYQFLSRGIIGFFAAVIVLKNSHDISTIFTYSCIAIPFVFFFLLYLYAINYRSIVERKQSGYYDHDIIFEENELYKDFIYWIVCFVVFFTVLLYPVISSIILIDILVQVLQWIDKHSIARWIVNLLSVIVLIQVVFIGIKLIFVTGVTLFRKIE